MSDRPEHCLGCNRVETHPVTLPDGTVVCNECPAWLAECEIRYVVGLRTNDERRTYLEHVTKHRGVEAAQALRMAAFERMRKLDASSRT